MATPTMHTEVRFSHTGRAAARRYPPGRVSTIILSQRVVRAVALSPARVDAKRPRPC